MKNNKVIIFSAPSGSGKSTVVNHLLKKFPSLEFSVSATSRSPRGNEQNGKEYFFFSPEEFRTLIDQNAFVEYEEVYSGSLYGTLRSEVERIWAKGHTIVFDIDVKGGVNLKKLFKESALAIFIKAPSIESLRERLIHRGTDSDEAIEKRVFKAMEELEYEKQFDKVIINDILEHTLTEADIIVEEFIS